MDFYERSGKISEEICRSNIFLRHLNFVQVFCEEENTWTMLEGEAPTQERVFQVAQNIWQMLTQSSKYLANIDSNIGSKLKIFGKY